MADWVVDLREAVRSYTLLNGPIQWQMETDGGLTIV
jgi:hypothetical protein